MAPRPTRGKYRPTLANYNAKQQIFKIESPFIKGEKKYNIYSLFMKREKDLPLLRTSDHNGGISEIS